MSQAETEATGGFDAAALHAHRCPDCQGSGELKFESENINENFEVEKQIVITECPRCGGKGYISG
jgi:DnaJ-class molecular chaperone